MVMLERNSKRPTDYRTRFEHEALGHLGALYGTALRLTHDQRDAEDLVQDALLSAFRSFDQFVPGSQFKAWLFKILTNTFINKYRRRVLERSVAQAMERTGETGVMSVSGVRAARDAEETLQYSLMADAIHKALADLPEEFRLAVVLCDVEEFSYREIADIMECPVGTVMSRLHRGRRLLQVALREQALRCGIVRAEPGLPGTDELDELAARRLPERASDKNAQVLQLPRRPAQGSQGLVAKKA